MTDKATLLALADRVEAQIEASARQGLPISKAYPAHEVSRWRMSYAADCVIVAAALRVMAGGVDHE
jgi:hypothetical protein